MLPELKSDMLEGAASVIAVPEVKPAIVSESNDGMVSECVDVIVQGVGLAAVELMEQVCARAGNAATAIATATAPPRTTNLRCMMTPVNGLAASLTHRRRPSDDSAIRRDHVLCSGRLPASARHQRLTSSRSRLPNANKAGTYTSSLKDACPLGGVTARRKVAQSVSERDSGQLRVVRGNMTTVTRHFSSGGVDTSRCDSQCLAGDPERFARMRARERTAP